ncbi:MAG TPA: threonine dehydratase [Steroidobacteraceae bacterium]|jgi:threonine dehydratase|nr:threonine dehydratase [Steroidobacteraceae bacterium]
MDIAEQARDLTPTLDRRLGDVHFDDIVAARRLLSRSLTPTPLVTHPLLSKRVGAEVHVKLENALPLGSFKLRGGLNFIANLTPEQRARGVVTATRGNHGQSLAYAAQRYGVSCVVFVPEGNNPDKSAAIEALGATVRVAGHDFDAAWDAAVEHAQRTGAIAVHPSREPHLIAGYATVALEMLDQASQPLDSVFVPVGGGSLAAGMGLVFKALSPHTRVIGVQSSAAPAIARAWRTGEIREVPVAETIADGLATRVPSPHTVDILREVLDDVIEVSEAEIAGAIRTLAETLHQLAEGAGAAALAGALQLRRRLVRQRVGVVLSGGNITSALLLKILHGELLGGAQRGAQLAETLADMEYGARTK